MQESYLRFLLIISMVSVRECLGENATGTRCHIAKCGQVRRSCLNISRMFFACCCSQVAFIDNLSTSALKGRYTFGNSQRPVFSLDVSHHNHNITSL